MDNYAMIPWNIMFYTPWQVFYSMLYYYQYIKTLPWNGYNKGVNMNTFTENTFDLLKVYFLSEWLAIPCKEFTKAMEGYRAGKYDLIIIDDWPRRSLYAWLLVIYQ